MYSFTLLRTPYNGAGKPAANSVISRLHMAEMLGILPGISVLQDKHNLMVGRCLIV